MNFSHRRKHSKPEFRLPRSRPLIVLLGFYRYHEVMISLLGTLLVRILEAMFAVGVLGSTIVLLITFVEDIETLFGREEPHHS